MSHIIGHAVKFAEPQVREWLMKLIAGGRPYWIANDTASQFASLHGVLGAGAVVALVHLLRQADISRAEFVVGEWTVTATRELEESKEKEDES